MNKPVQAAHFVLRKVSYIVYVDPDRPTYFTVVEEATPAEYAPVVAEHASVWNNYNLTSLASLVVPEPMYYSNGVLVKEGDIAIVGNSRYLTGKVGRQGINVQKIEWLVSRSEHMGRQWWSSYESQLLNRKSKGGST